MPSGVPYANIGDFANHALAKFHMRKQFFKTTKYQKFRVVDELFRDTKVKYSDGNELQWRKVYSASGLARFIRPFQVTPNNTQDVFVKGNAPWRNAETKATYNQLLANKMSGESELVDYVMGQMAVAVEALVELLEESAFDVPQDSTDDGAALGFPYWFPQLAVGVASEGGFDGITAVFGDASTTTTIGGIDRSANVYERSYVFTHSGINSTYLKRLAKAQDYTGFVMPRDLKAFTAKVEQTPYEKWRYYTSIDDRLAYEEIVNSGSDNRNGDARPFYGDLNYRGMMWYDAPVLNLKANQPGYAINLSKAFPWVNSKMWMKKGEPIQQDDRHTYVIPWDCEFNYAVVDPRNGGFCCHTVRS